MMKKNISGSNVTSKERCDKALNEAKKVPVPACKVYEYVNEFIESCRKQNGYTPETVRSESLELDGKTQKILNNGVIVRDCSWQDPGPFNNKTKEYEHPDKKYDVLKTTFDLVFINDFVWLRFAKSGHLVTVAKGCDINFDKSTTSYKLLDYVKNVTRDENYEYDDSFVFIFPITKEILGVDKNNKRIKHVGDIECGVGNYLIEKDIPIIDYYSHMYQQH